MNKINNKMLIFIVLTMILGGILLNYSNSSRHETYQSQCPFCRVVAHEEGTILYEDADVAVITKNRPVRAPFCVDCLIIPKKHIHSLEKLNPRDSYDQTILAKMDLVAQKLGKKLCGDGGFTTHINDEAHQGVLHLHMHFKSPNAWKVDPLLWK